MFVTWTAFAHVIRLALSIASVELVRTRAAGFVTIGTPKPTAPLWTAAPAGAYVAAATEAVCRPLGIKRPLETTCGVSPP
jgi:hypothetical protein